MHRTVVLAGQSDLLVLDVLLPDLPVVAVRWLTTGRLLPALHHPEGPNALIFLVALGDAAAAADRIHVINSGGVALVSQDEGVAGLALLVKRLKDRI